MIVTEVRYLAFVLAAIVVLAWIENWPVQLLNEIASYVSRAEKPAYFGLFTPADTYAQWIMAALALAATGISAWGVLLLRDNLRLTRIAVQAAEDAVAVTREIGNAQLRAYVLPQKAEIENITRDDGSSHVIIVRLHYSNSGQTPGFIFRHDKATVYIPHAERLEPFQRFDNLGKHPVQPTTPIGPGGTHHIRFDIAPEMLVRAQTKNVQIVLYDIIQYRDMQGKEHRTTWCGVAKFYGWKYQEGKMFLDGKQAMVDIFPHHNEAD